MRRLVLAAAITAVITSAVGLPFAAHAQGGHGRDQQSKDDEDAAKKKKRDQEWSDTQAPLPALRNAGPCPFVKSLYDANRYIEFKDDKQASSNVVYSGEIQGISAGCRYKDADPITVSMDVLFELGRGPQAHGMSKTYRYWVAVTDRNRDVIAKQEFDLPVTFTPGKDRVYVTDSVANIVIPRGGATTSGANFEVLVGFDVTPEMAAFNRDGKRFRVNAGSTTVASGDSSTRR